MIVRLPRFTCWRIITAAIPMSFVIIKLKEDEDCYLSRDGVRMFRGEQAPFCESFAIGLETEFIMRSSILLVRGAVLL